MDTLYFSNRDLYVIPEEVCMNPLKLLDLPNQVIRSSGSVSLDLLAVEDEDMIRSSSLISLVSSIYGYRETLDNNINREFKDLVVWMRILSFVTIIFVVCMIIIVVGIKMWVK